MIEEYKLIYLDHLSKVSNVLSIFVELESRSGRGVQHYVIKFVSDLRQVGDFLRLLRLLPPIKLTVHDITEILLESGVKHQ
jgi:hypothetical protein